MTAETDLFAVPVIRDTVDLEEWRDACVSSATEALRAEVERLKAVAHGFVDEIAEKDRRADRLAEALRPLAELDLRPDNLETAPDWQTIYARNKSEIKVGDVRRARAALDQENSDVLP